MNPPPASAIAGSHAPARAFRRFDALNAALLAERDENTCRKDFTASEAVAMAKALEPPEKAAAAERHKVSTTNRSERYEKFSERSTGEAKDKIAAAIGMSRPKLGKARPGRTAGGHAPARAC